jgi:hypothetical protein
MVKLQKHLGLPATEILFDFVMLRLALALLQEEKEVDQRQP